MADTIQNSGLGLALLGVVFLGGALAAYVGSLGLEMWRERDSGGLGYLVALVSFLLLYVGGLLMVAGGLLR